MDCSACRSQFSQSFDGRLAGEPRQRFIIHLQTCEPCSSEYALYRRVFSAVRGLPEEAAPPFRVPAEVPGALSAQSAIGGRPRFARVAAAVLIAIGLLGSHVLVFEWSRDRASREPGSPAPRAATSELASTMLPAALRDHVDATDLFIRTAANLPDDASSHDLAYADWVTTNLPQRTAELRAQLPSFPESDRGMISQYLDDMEKDFIPQMLGLIQNEGDRAVPIARIRERAVQNRVVLNEDIEKLKVLTASLPRGTTFRFSGEPARGLRPDARVFLDSKHRRLAGDMPAALEGFQRFDTEFQKSALRPVAQSLQFETLGASGRYADQYNFMRRVVVVQGSMPDPLAMATFAKWGTRMSIMVSFNTDGDLQGVHLFQLPIPTTPLKSDAPPACLQQLSGSGPEGTPPPKKAAKAAEVPK